MIRLGRGGPPAGGGSDLRRKIDELAAVDARISAMAEDDPLGALFIVKNLRVAQGLDEKPLVAKILLRIADKLDTAVRQDQPEKARVYKSLIQKLVQELEVAQIYDSVIVATRGMPEGGEQRDELLEDVSLEESIADVRPPTA